MDLTISTVYFNSKHLPDVARSVDQSVFRGRLEHILVDNASRDQSHLSQTLATFPRLRVIRNPRNLGFAAANNLALKEAGGKYFALLNPDIFLETDTLQILFDFLEGHPDVVAVSCRIVDANGRVLASRRRYPTLFAVLSRFLPDVPGAGACIREYEMADTDPGECLDVDWLSGAFIVCRTDILRSIGGLDERFFLYFEDVDLCRRLHSRGRVVYAPFACCRHLTRHASRTSAKLFCFHVASSAKYFLKWGL